MAASSEGPINRENRSSYLVNYRYSTLALLENIGLNILSDQEKITFQDISFKVHLPTEKFGSFSLWGLGGRNTYTFRPIKELGETLYEDEVRSMGVTGVTNVFFFNEPGFPVVVGVDVDAIGISSLNAFLLVVIIKSRA